MKRDEVWRIACEVKAEMDAGAHMSRAEKAAKAIEEDAPLPTLAGALDAYLAHQTGPRFSGKSQMRDGTAKEYRGSFDLHLSTWANVQVDKLPTRNINLNSTPSRKIKRAAASALLGTHWDRVTVDPVDLSVWVDDRLTRRKEPAIIALKVMMMEWIGWGEQNLTQELTGQQPWLVRVLAQVEPVAIASLALHLRRQHGM